MGNGFVVGIKYYQETWGREFTTSSDTVERSTMGLMGGYNFDAFLVQASYLAIDPPAEKTAEDDGSEKTYKDGSGMIFDFMYMFDIGGFQFGPQISYIQFDYSKWEDENGGEIIGGETLVERSDSWIKPQFAFTAIF